MRARGRKTKDRWVLTFEKFFVETTFINDVKKVLKTPEEKYQYPLILSLLLILRKKEILK